MKTKPNSLSINTSRMTNRFCFKAIGPARMLMAMMITYTSAGPAEPHWADSTPGWGHEGKARRVGGGIAQVRQDAHSPGHLGGRAVHVHRAAAGAQCMGAFDHCRLEPVAGQPVRQGRTGDARPADQHPVLSHTGQPNVNTKSPLVTR